MQSMSAFESISNFTTFKWPFCAAWYSGVHRPYKIHKTLTLQHFHHNVISTHMYIENVIYTAEDHYCLIRFYCRHL